MSTYLEKLKDPRWQRKKAEILLRDGYACVSCGDKESTLYVHHGYYEKKLEPWEYRDDTLWTLCDFCHDTAEVFRNESRAACGRIHPDDQLEVMELLNLLSGEAADWSPGMMFDIVDFLKGYGFISLRNLVRKETARLTALDKALP